MWDGVVGREIRRANRNMILVNVLLVACVGLVGLGLGERYLFNALRGPAAMTQDALVAITDPDKVSRNFVTVKADKELGAIWSHYERTKDSNSGRVISEKTTAWYVGVKVGKNLVLVKSDSEHPKTTLTGFLEPIDPATRSHLREFLAKSKATDLEQLFCPFLLDTQENATSAWAYVFIGLPLLCFLLWNVNRGFMRYSNPEVDPAAVKLGPGPEQVAAAVDKDLFSAPEGMPFLMGKQWLVRSRFMSVDIVNVPEQLLWIYKKVTQHYYNGVPTGKSYHVMVRGWNGLTMEVKTNEATGDATLKAMLHRWPWLIAGYSDELEQTWKANPASLGTAVAQRKKAAAAAEAGAAAAGGAATSGPALNPPSARPSAGGAATGRPPTAADPEADLKARQAAAYADAVRKPGAPPK